MSVKAPITVSQLNELVRMTLDASRLFASVAVVGEISNLKIHFASGHIYFSLKDADSVLKCVMFRASANSLKFVPENGMKVVAKGRVSVFTRDGQYQLYAEEMEPDGLGSRYLAFEQLKTKLAGEGLFDESKKKPLPPMPKQIGVITSASGAAFQDILNILRRRYPIGTVLLYPASVQGAEAAASLTEAVHWFTSHPDTADVIIIGRGGGSFEDLNAFNDERLARAIFVCPVPIVSAVGHETDFTICDFVSDKRAPTPSAAAELVAPDISVLQDNLSMYEKRMKDSVLTRIDRLNDRVFYCSKSKMLSSPMETVNEKEKQFLQKNDAFQKTAEEALCNKEMLVCRLTEKLNALSPLAVLTRGYSAVFDEKGKIITGIDSVNAGDTVSLRFANGTANAKVISTRKMEDVQNG